ncbi:la-related protein Larp4B-like [Phoenix dactylifera]|uniref:La-related protein Larp4B-like n=1 Tax=Phoenix dactylifera TaxID=42345 RepID=A0A8B7BIT4_PHODC|nr:la-related protein Larp4B-like [Phoenix dactylifera]
MEGGGGMPGGMLPSSMSSAGLLGLEMPLHQHQHQHPHHQQQQFLHPHHHHQQQQQQQHIFPFQPPHSGIDADHPMRHASSSYSPYGARGKQQPTLSSEDEQQPGPGDEGDGARRVSSQSPTPSPWQRMKWTDSMVRLLISVVYRVGDDGGGVGGVGAEGEPQQSHSAAAAAASASSAAKGKKGPGASASATSASALLQKKGKWKSVSRAMMEKGFYVSPQQCEDKFNDLNKRYKRVNDLLGKGTACRVVENQALLDTLDQLSPKAKEEARKLLNSKHLFFREMCAYHNATAAASCAAANVASAPLPQMQPPPPPHADQQQLCLHHPPTAVSVGKGGTTAVEEDGMETYEDEDDDDDVDTEEDDDDDEQEDEEDETDYHHKSKHRSHHGGCHHQQQRKLEEPEEVEDSKGLVGDPGKAEGAKRARRMFSGGSPLLSLSLSSPSTMSTSIQQLKSELMGMAGGGEQQQRQWLKRRVAELEEQRVGYDSRALQLERQRFKWLRFSTNKEREMERMKLENDSLRLENERMLLLLRQKELELLGSGGGGGGADNHLQQQ